jgi:16S rRNA (guanine966-N2)-methyltransferase
MTARSGRLRIVAGTHRGRRIEVPPGDAARPTGDRVRESLFSILESGRAGIPELAGAHVLDAFAGSGALGIEALSRGAGHTTFFDTDRSAIATIEANVDALGLSDRAVIRRADALRPPAPGADACDFVFLDPPYDSGMTQTAAKALTNAGWVAPDGLLAVEMRRGDTFATPPGFERIDGRTYGDTELFLLIFIG